MDMYDNNKMIKEPKVPDSALSPERLAARKARIAARQARRAQRNQSSLPIKNTSLIPNTRVQGGIATGTPGAKSVNSIYNTY
jgi:hypothetical protein